ncbi:c-type cytochrome [Flavobacterium daemonense]|uniref:c-type cytochrome n=1 Tax=Flavobacterium daemonense TaxID=1393049 RepID=UPI001186FD5A|nr:c-type cytochrome [Flavobacterium daemonense]KAF2335503.1 cytochrome c [Flavobacterium daemonense]
MKKIRFLYLSLLLILVLAIGIIIYERYKDENRGCATQNPKHLNKTLTANQRIGKVIFDSNCAACHKKDSKSTGPALHEIDSIVFVNWLTDKKHKIDSTKTEILAIDYHKTVFSKTLSEKDVTALIDYCHTK